MKEIKEVWIPIIGFTGYAANKKGEVLSTRKSGEPRVLKGVGYRTSYALISDTGVRRKFKIKRIVYAILHNINPDSINGYIVGHIDDLRIVTKEELFDIKKIELANGKKVSDGEIKHFYDETLHDIQLIRNFHHTGDIAPVIKAVHACENFIVGYIIKYTGYSKQTACDIWSSIQEEILIGIFENRFRVMNIRAYLSKMIRSNATERRKKRAREVAYADYKEYNMA